MRIVGKWVLAGELGWDCLGLVVGIDISIGFILLRFRKSHQIELTPVQHAPVRRGSGRRAHDQLAFGRLVVPVAGLQTGGPLGALGAVASLAPEAHLQC